MSRSFWMLVGWLLVAFTGAPAQDGPKYPIPDKIERATKADDKGMLQWEAWPDTKCPSCQGSGKMKCVTCARFPEEAKSCPECKRTKEREAVCRTCGGSGKWADPLEKVPCAGCMGSSFLLCLVCQGGGQLRVDKAKNWSDCPGCRGDGAFKCSVCNGTRSVEVAAVKPSLKDGSVANLDKALAATDTALKELAAFTPAGGDKARKAVKALNKTYETAGATHPALKRLTKALDDYMGKLAAGAQFQGHAEMEANAMAQVKANSEYYLKHQKRMLELAHKRAEANAKLAAEQKGK